MVRATIAIQTEPGRPGQAAIAASALDLANGNVLYSGAEGYYFEVINTHATNSITVTALRKACPTCGAVAEPAGNGAITLAALAQGFIGPFPANLYGQGDSGKDIYLDTTGTGTGTVKAYAV